MHQSSLALSVACALAGCHLSDFLPRHKTRAEKQAYIDSINPGPPLYDVAAYQQAQAAKPKKKSRAQRKKGGKP